MADNALISASGGGGPSASIYGLLKTPTPLNPIEVAIQAERLNQSQAAADFQAQQTHLGNLRAVHGELGGLAGKRDLSLDDVEAAADRLVDGGFMSRKSADLELRAARRIGANPDALRALLGGHVNAIGDHHDQAAAAYGVPSTLDTGDQVLTRTVSPSLGVKTLATDARTLSPQDKATRSATFQNGQPGTAPTSSNTDRYGYPLRTPLPGAQSSAGGGAPGAMAPAGFVPTGPGLGQTRVAEGGADMYVKDLQAAAGSSGELANLQAALGPLQGLGATGTGPGVAGRNRIASALQAVGLGRLPGVDPKKIEDLDEATSYLGSAARSGALSPGGGQATGTGAPTTPSLDISQPAAVNLVRAQIGLKRFQQAQARSYQGQDNGAGYAGHAATFATEQDPRAYAFDLRTPAEKQKLLDSLGSKDGPAYKKFIKSLRTAHDLGLTNAAGQ